MGKTGIKGLLMIALMAAGVACAAPLKTQDVLEIWPNGVAPGSENAPVKLTITERSKVAFWPDRIITGITRPNLTAFVPDKPNGTAVIVAPGGAYARIVLDKEAAEMARWLNPYGVTVLLMQYRLPAEGHANGKDAPLADASVRFALFVRMLRNGGWTPTGSASLAHRRRATWARYWEQSSTKRFMSRLMPQTSFRPARIS